MLAGKRGMIFILDLKKGLFTGEMMHLRDIERTFGENSLRILGSWVPTDDDDNPDKVAGYKKIYKFFATDDAAEREKLRQELLLVVE